MRNLWRLIASRTTGKIARRIEQPPMKLPPLIFWILLIACCPSLAAQDERFVELEEYPAKTRTYDLRSVQMIRGRICKTPEVCIAGEGAGRTALIGTDFRPGLVMIRRVGATHDRRIA